MKRRINIKQLLVAEGACLDYERYADQGAATK